MRRPDTVPGRVWLDQYFTSVAAFVHGGATDQNALVDAARHLGFLLQREPGYAREVRQLAAQCALGARSHPDAIAALAQVALDAEVMSAELVVEPSPTSLAMACLADAQRIAGRRLDGLATLDRLAARTAGDHLHRLVSARAWLARAELEELDLEVSRSAEAFGRARTESRGLIGDAELAHDYVSQIFGPRDSSIESQVDQIEAGLQTMLTQTYVAAVLGSIRTSSAASSPPLEELAAELTAALAVHGLASAAEPLLLVEPLGRLDPAASTALAEAIEAGRATARRHLAGSLDAAGLGPDLTAALRETLDAHDRVAEPVATQWRVAATIAHGRSLMNHTDRTGRDDARAVFVAAVETAIGSGAGLSQLCAIGAFVVHLAASGELDDPIVGSFLLALGGTLDVEPDLFDDLRYRALIDEPLAAITTWELSRADALTADGSRLRIALLLDLARRARPPDPATLLAVAALDADATLDPAATTGPQLLADTIDRTRAALARRPRTLALVVHGDGRTTSFLTIDATGATVDTGADVGPELAALEQAAETLVQTGAGAGDVDAAARAAFDALPGAVQAKVRDASTVLVVPDYRRDVEVFPVELLHDGGAYLLESKVVSRFVSLEHLAHSLDTRSGRTNARRALVTAAPEGIPGRPLYGALAERDAIATTLRDVGFDAPDVDPARLDAGFYRDRLGFVDVLHIAAHGESAAGIEYVCLERGERMTTDDVLAAPAPWMPVVYLNTCQLARTRYLGGGQGRGLAHACCELGAPAVVANTADVLDEVSTAIATGFYDAALTHPVGPALRLARTQTIELGYHPALVGRLIQFGDPQCSIVPVPVDADGFDPATSLLDTFFDPPDDPDARAAVWASAVDLVERGLADRRLLAAAMLVARADELDDGEPDRTELDACIRLADDLRHPPAQAVLRVVRARALADAETAEGTAETLDAIAHLRRLEHHRARWRDMLHSLRGELRRRSLERQGFGASQVGGEPGALDTAELDAIFAEVSGRLGAEQEILGTVTLRPTELTEHDVAWNAVVVGHPNRFEEPGQAYAFGHLLARKLVARGSIDVAAEPYAAPMLTGLLWHLWSTQRAGYLEPRRAEAQSAAVEAMLDDIRSRWSPLPDGDTRRALDAVGVAIDATLSDLDAMTWEQVTSAIGERIAACASSAEEALAVIRRRDPFLLAGAGAYLAGVLAAKNTYSYVDGSVAESIHDAMTKAMWTVSLANEARMFAYLNAGAARTRRPPDELDRWRAAALQAMDPAG